MQQYVSHDSEIIHLVARDYMDMHVSNMLIGPSAIVIQQIVANGGHITFQNSICDLLGNFSQVVAGVGRQLMKKSVMLFGNNLHVPRAYGIQIHKNPAHVIFIHCHAGFIATGNAAEQAGSGCLLAHQLHLFVQKILWGLCRHTVAFVAPGAEVNKAAPFTAEWSIGKRVCPENRFLANRTVYFKHGESGFPSLSRFKGQSHGADSVARAR